MSDAADRLIALCVASGLLSETEAADAPAERRAQYAASIRTLRKFAADLYEQAGEWKRAADLTRAVGNYTDYPWDASLALARIEAQRGRIDRSAEHLRTARSQGLDSAGAVEIDARFGTYRETPGYAALREEFRGER
jgi:hypothetical protein